MKRVLVSGSLAYDRIMDFPGLFKDHFMADKLHNINVSFVVKNANKYFGGTAGNIAYNLALLAEKPIILSTAGNDFASLKDHLERSGADCSLVQERTEDMTAFVYLVTDEHNNQIAAFYPGSSETPFAAVPPVEEADFAIVAPGCLADMQHLPELYKKQGLPYLFDPGQRITALSGDELLAGIEGSAGLFTNDYELALILEKTGVTEADLVSRTGFLVVTFGEKGSRIVTTGGETKVPAVPVEKVLDPTGAGDAYRAGFMKGLLHSLPHETCAKLASTVAAYAVEWYGTQNHTFTHDELKSRFEGAYKESFPY